MNRVTLDKINEINSFLVSMSATDRALPLRLCNMGFNIYKIPGLKEYRTMTTGEFLEKVASLENIPRPVSRLVDAVMSFMTSSFSRQIFSKAIPAIESQVRHEPCMLPMNTEATIFEQVTEVIETLIKGMETANDRYKKSARRLSLGFNKGMSDEEVAQVEKCHRERIRQIRAKFQSDLMQGRVPNELAREYKIRDSFISLAKSTISSFVNQELRIARESIGSLSEEKVRYILDMLGLKIVEIEGVRFVLSKSNFSELVYLAQRAKIQLKKEYDYVPLSTLIPAGTLTETIFIRAYLNSMPQVYEFANDGTSVRMIGAGLQKATRQARIIFEAGEPVSIADIALRYKELYGEEMTIFQTNVLRQMGFSPMGKTTKWRFGEPPAKARQLIREIINPTHPIATLNTIVRAIEKEGLEYPLSTIKTYITEIATSENKQPDLFCLKGYCHLYPTYSWRKFRKAIA